MALTPFKIDIASERADDGVHLKFGCRIDASTAKEFEAALREAEDSDAPMIFVDLRDVEFMNYKGLTVLYDAHKRWIEQGERIRVVACSLQVRNLFAMSGLYDRFMAHKEKDKAAASEDNGATADDKAAAPEDGAATAEDSAAAPEG